MSLGTSMLIEAASAGEPLAVILFDIDHFKRINDTYGHDVGDQALLHIADLCRRALRTEDLLARYGGEEFVIALPGLTAERAESAAHRIRRELAAQPLDVPGGELRMTASFGIAATAGLGGDARSAAGLAEGARAEADAVEGAGADAGTQLKRLLKQADLALYAAKQGGRDAVRLAAVGGASA
ncbi:GGDEF domain-containing protein [Cohnella ginsengisoli]|uniref:GGDEF domain-containing protein n=1 Tax=Cohnella ginsengisoli TaxID=425004 RepID=A0A9X4KTA9_9BACL|nr:GGDEF domain-containing protein [Cohnella ginsengisoli]MDG0795195.1 GGDEF domain-containing protein [Cohnella ginsengisoli]